MKHIWADEIDRVEIRVGEEIRLESLRQAVVPPYLMLMPFITLPEGITLVEQSAPEEEGVHGCSYLLRADSPTQGECVVGFRDLRTRQETHRKSIRIRSL